MKARKKKLNMLSSLEFKLDSKSLEVLFSSFVSTTMYYGIEVWGGSYGSYLIKLEHIVIDGMKFKFKFKFIYLLHRYIWYTFIQWRRGHQKRNVVCFFHSLLNELCVGHGKVASEVRSFCCMRLVTGATKMSNIAKL